MVAVVAGPVAADPLRLSSRTGRRSTQAAGPAIGVDRRASETVSPAPEAAAATPRSAAGEEVFAGRGCPRSARGPGGWAAATRRARAARRHCAASQQLPRIPPTRWSCADCPGASSARFPAAGGTAWCWASSTTRARGRCRHRASRARRGRRGGGRWAACGVRREALQAGKARLVQGAWGARRSLLAAADRHVAWQARDKSERARRQASRQALCGWARE